MTCSDFLTLPLLHVAARGQEMTLAALRTATANRMNLSAADLADKIPSGRQTRFNNLANWACIYILRAREGMALGEYRSRRLVLEQYDILSGAIGAGRGHIRPAGMGGA